MELIKQTLLDAVQAAGAIMRAQPGGGAVTYKSSWSDLVTEVDGAVERALFALIRERFPDHGMLGEEGGGAFDRPFTWVLDPIDGTTNFAHGLPNWTCSLACCQGDQVVAGAVYDPGREELFLALRGEGATLNGRPIRVDGATGLREALVGTNLLWDLREERFHRLPQLQALGREVRGVRSLGSAALELAYVAAGRLSGFAQFHLSPWDFAAGWLLVEEAGGRVSDFAGRPLAITQSGPVLASNGAIHGAMVAHLGIE